MTHTTVSDRIGLGIMMMLLTYFLFTVVDTSAKWLLGLGFPALQLAFLRYAGHFAISVGLAMNRGRSGQALGRDKIGLVILRGSLLVIATIGNFFALRFLPLTVVSAIMFSSPIIVCLLSMRFLGERVGPWRWAAILLGFLGVLVVIRPFGESFHWAATLSVMNAVLLAIYSLMTRHLAKDVPTATLQFYGGATGTLILAVPALLVWQPADNLGILVVWSLLGFGGWAGHELLTRAHVIAPANVLMPFGYSYLIYMMAADFLFFGLLPDWVALSGIAMIVAAGLTIWKRGRGGSS